MCTSIGDRGMAPAYARGAIPLAPAQSALSPLAGGVFAFPPAPRSRSQPSIYRDDSGHLSPGIERPIGFDPLPSPPAPPAPTAPASAAKPPIPARPIPAPRRPSPSLGPSLTSVEGGYYSNTDAPPSTSPR
jgi:hypothetical protein